MDYDGLHAIPMSLPPLGSSYSPLKAPKHAVIPYIPWLFNLNGRMNDVSIARIRFPPQKKTYTPHSHVIPLLFSYPSNDIGWCPIVVQVSFEAQ
jgi:hypothetical protein